MAEVDQEIPDIPEDIQKLPEDIQKLPEEIPEKSEETQKKPEIKPETAEAPAPKRKGRPPGAKNKAPPKPRKVVLPEEPVIVQAVQAPVHRVAAAELQQRPIPTQARDTKETIMLRLLAEQARNRQERKLAKWRRMFV